MLLASEMKQAFLSTILTCLLALEQPKLTFGNNTPPLPPSSNPPMAYLAFISQHCFLPTSLTFKDLVDYTGPTWIIQNCPVYDHLVFAKGPDMLTGSEISPWVSRGAFQPAHICTTILDSLCCLYQYFLPFWGWAVFHYIKLFTCSVDGQWGLPPLLTIMDKTILVIVVQVCWWAYMLFLLGKYLVLELLARE